MKKDVQMVKNNIEQKIKKDELAKKEKRKSWLGDSLTLKNQKMFKN